MKKITFEPISIMMPDGSIGDPEEAELEIKKFIDRMNTKYYRELIKYSKNHKSTTGIFN